MGFVLAFALREKFDLKSGQGNLTKYLFNTKQIQHLFCTTCGVQSFAYGKLPDGGEMVAINVNCMTGVDTRKLDSKAVDGKSM